MTHIDILKYLKHSDTPVSGELLAGELGVSRTAIWKGVEKLKKQGAVINSVSGKGYTLLDSSRVLCADSVNELLDTNRFKNKITVVDTITSTNTYLKNNVQQDTPEGTTIVSKEQTKGRGRLGRSFHSPKGNGLYMSTLLKPVSLSAGTAQKLTILAAVAVCDAVNNLYGVGAKIKWVNDIYIAGKKLCGILTEGNISAETGIIDYAVVGMGINLYGEKDFPDDIKDIATTLSAHTHKTIDQSQLVAEIFNRLSLLYDDILEGKTLDIISRYQELSFIIGKTVKVISRDGDYPAVVHSIGNDGQLIVKTKSGETRQLAAGEVSLKI